MGIKHLMVLVGVACITSSLATAAKSPMTPVEAAGQHVRAPQTRAYLVQPPYGIGPEVLVVSELLSNGDRTDVAFEFNKVARTNTAELASLWVSVSEGGKTATGDCTAAIENIDGGITISIHRCLLSTGQSLSTTVATTTAPEPLALEKVAEVAPSLAPAVTQVLSQVQIPGGEIFATFDGLGNSNEECSCAPSCTAYLNSCLIASWSCGPWYAVCASVCYSQYGSCLQGCGC